VCLYACVCEVSIKRGNCYEINKRNDNEVQALKQGVKLSQAKLRQGKQFSTLLTC
jgi:hypothetical protein